MSNELINLCNVSKTFGKRNVLNNINLSINKGQSIGLIGHNGSGKSTFLKMVSGLTNIDTGKITYRNPLKFNYVPEHFPKMDITAKQYIEHMGLIDGLRYEFIQEESHNLFERFFMEDMINTPMKHLSKGTLQKVGVVQALITKPDVLLLDEPLSGQDIDSQNVFIELIHRLNLHGVTIIMSCHEKFLLARLSKTIYEIKNGSLETRELHNFSLCKYDILHFLNSNKDNFIDSHIESLVHKIDFNDNKIEMLVETEKSNEVIKKMLDNGYILRGMYNE